jgi:hypothetical protein
LARLELNIAPGNPPTAVITTPALTTTVVATLILAASGSDQDEAGQAIVGWEWTVGNDAALCTAPTCTLPAQVLGVGVHSIRLRVQDDEGLWSAPVTTTVTVHPEVRVYLPVIQGGQPAR